MASTTSSKQNARDVFYPPLDGSLFLPEIAEFNAEHNSAHPFYTFYDEQLNGIRRISHLEFYRACQRVAHAIRPNRQGSDNGIVAIIANSDTILYQALTMGIIYAGLIPFAMSPRNSPAAVVNMMRETGCRRLIATRHSLASLLDGISAELPDLQIDDPPTLAYAYPVLGKETANTPFVPYPKAETRPLKDNVMLYLHSSGSTGFPKPIPVTYITGVHWCLMPTIQDHINLPRDITICGAALPSFHMMGTLLQLFYPIASLQNIAVFPPTSYVDPAKAPIIPNSDNILEVVQSTKSSSMLIVPAFLEEWVTLPQALEVLSSLEVVAFAGGPLSKKTGDALVAAGVQLSSVYGGTEFGPLTYTYRSPNEQLLWEWVRFGPNQTIRWVPQGDGTYECQLLTSATHQLSVENLPDVKGYTTSDIFAKHPDIEGLYKIVGRVDDVLIHSSGEKTVPAPMETVISANPLLSGVCMFGRGRNQAGVLVEPRPDYTIDVTDDKQVAEFRNKIWRDVEDANRDAPAFSRIFKEMILVTSKDKPMLRAGKGTVMKKATVNLYEPEIDALYASVEESSKAGIDIPLPSAWTQPDVENWLEIHASAVHEGKPIVADADLFEQGFDSLSSTFLKNRIIGSLAASSDQKVRAVAPRISQNVIFSNPTLRLLARHLTQLVSGTDAAAADPRAEIEDMIVKYSVGLEVDAGRQSRSQIDHSHVVLLTGSTGGLGSYLLASLLSREDVGAVYAFNRPSKTGTIQERQHAGFEDRGLNAALLDSRKLVYLEGDTTQPNLSLGDATYAKIRDSVTIIIHNAWRLDFNLALASFESNVRGTRHLIDLARASSKADKPRFLFTSSVSSAQGWDKSKGAFPEEVQLDAGVAVGPGYGASKYVAERILAVSGLPATSFRIGQITGGAPRGAWSTTDWVPIIVKSSVALGALPGARGVTSWLPPHAVSDAILDVAFATEEPPLAVNLVHPRPVAWESIMEPISQAVHQKHLTPSPLPLIPFTEWVERLEKYVADANEEDIRRVPAIKLAGFMRVVAQGDAAMRGLDGSNDLEVAGSAMFATDGAEKVSKTMRDLAPLSAEDVTQWVSYWESVGMFAGAIRRSA